MVKGVEGVGERGVVEGGGELVEAGDGEGGGEEESRGTPRLIADALEFIAGPLMDGPGRAVVGAASDVASVSRL